MSQEWEEKIEDAFLDGKVAGYDEGYSQGYDSGFEAGYDEGYRYGYDNGVAIMENGQTVSDV